MLSSWHKDVAYHFGEEDGCTLLVSGVPGQESVYIRLNKGERNADLRDGADAVEAFLEGQQ